MLWLRPTEFCQAPALIKDGVAAGDVCQGQLGDCWFLGALSVVASRLELLQRVMPGTAVSNDGSYTFNFYKFGEWHQVKIDDRLPCNEAGPLFASGKDANECWVLLIEKAYAKLHAQYGRLVGGFVTDGMVDLTGGFPRVLYFDKLGDEIASGGLWTRLLENHQSGNYIMGCAKSTSGTREADTGQGILQGHAYGIMEVREVEGERLFRVRNPWGCTEWTGEWSDQDKRWDADLLATLDYELGDDGTFWICYDDFVKQFNKIYLCRLLDDSYKRIMFRNEWKGELAGGCANHSTWVDNPQYVLTVFEPDTEVIISLQQRDPRQTGKKGQFMGMALLATDGSKSTSYNPIAQSDINNLRENVLEVVLEPGRYNILPFTFEPNVELEFHLTVASAEQFDVDSHQPGEEPMEGSAPHVTDREAPKVDPASIKALKADAGRGSVSSNSLAAHEVEPDDDGALTDVIHKVLDQLGDRYPMLKKMPMAQAHAAIDKVAKATKGCKCTVQ